MGRVSKETLESVIAEAEGLRRSGHYECEDGFYSCPKHPDSFTPEAAGTDCNCGMEKHNAKVEALIANLRSCLPAGGGLTWTSERPKVPGHYWMRAPFITKEIFHTVEIFKILRANPQAVLDQEIEFAGPILEPTVFEKKEGENG